jgi:hypothetical protein
MASDSKLAKSIKRYSDIFGTVLLGMHQDLTTQQQTVDKKLAVSEEQWRTRSEEIVAVKIAVTSVGDEVKSRAIAIEYACERLERVIESTNSAMTNQLNAIDAASTGLFEDIKLLLNQAKTESAKRLESIEQMQSQYQTHSEELAKQTRRLLFMAVVMTMTIVVLGVFLR